MVKTIKGHQVDSAQGGEFRANLIDISSTGSQITSHTVLENHSMVSLELDSMDGSHVVTYRGRVVWVRKNPMKSMGRFAYGVNFEALTPDQIRFLENNYSLNSSPAEE